MWKEPTHVPNFDYYTDINLSFQEPSIRGLAAPIGCINILISRLL